MKKICVWLRQFLHEVKIYNCMKNSKLKFASNVDEGSSGRLLFKLLTTFQFPSMMFSVNVSL